MADHGFSVTLSELDPTTRLQREPAEELKKHLSQSVSLFDRYLLRDHPARSDWRCRQWVPELAPGTYAVTSLNERLLIGNPRPGVSPLVSLITTVGMAAISQAQKDQIAFADEDGKIQPSAPEFTISSGEVVYLGTIAFEADLRQRQKPVRDNAGYWDGQQTESVIDRRFYVTYAPPGAEMAEVNSHITEALKANTSRSLAALEGRQLLLEDFPEIKPEDRM
ncbi:hypothetical protein NUH88_07715 [Nisaea acidiphila]|uniref:Uncharacterized protein n=1 Tax=Nisaea acidiphila TaxID=1862145 RepID=A0A9J7AW42_9PROT|nr:hypothetical protein [Nisaea acidiphila]UUX51575.1 hypothetical protein NUH88_07715 [Nisaea acidiphila]